MSGFDRDIDSAIHRYQGLVWTGERRALRVAEDEPRRAAIVSNLYQRVAHWLSALWANRTRAQLHSRAAHREQVVG